MCKITDGQWGITHSNKIYIPGLQLLVQMEREKEEREID